MIPVELSANERPLEDCRTASQIMGVNGASCDDPDNRRIWSLNELRAVMWQLMQDERDHNYRESLMYTGQPFKP